MIVIMADPTEPKSMATLRYTAGICRHTAHCCFDRTRRQHIGPFIVLPRTTPSRDLNAVLVIVATLTHVSNAGGLLMSYPGQWDGSQCQPAHACLLWQCNHAQSQFRSRSCLGIQRTRRLGVEVSVPGRCWDGRVLPVHALGRLST